MSAGGGGGGGSVCLDCRTLLGAGERCDGGPRHRVVSMADPAQRERLVSEVWGPPSARRRARQLAKAGGGGAGFGGALEGCSGCGDIPSGEAGAIILLVVAMVIVAVLLVWAILKIVEAVRRRRARLKPSGALAGAPSLGPHSKQVGRVVSVLDGSERSPVSGAACGAWAVALTASRHSGSAVMLRAARSAGLEIELTDGRRVRVPAGRVRLGPPSRRVKPGTPELIEFLQAVDPRLDPAEEHPPLPVDGALELLLREGDQVEVLGELTPSAEPAPGQAAAGPYRAAAAMLLVPTGVPALRPVP